MKDKDNMSLGALEKKGIRASKGSAEWINPDLAMANALGRFRDFYLAEVKKINQHEDKPNPQD